MLVVWLIGPCFYVPFFTITSGISRNGKCILFNNYANITLRYLAPDCLILFIYIFPLTLMIFFYASMNLSLRRKVNRIGQLQLQTIAAPKVLKTDSNLATLDIIEDKNTEMTGLAYKKQEPNVTNHSESIEIEKI